MVRAGVVAYPSEWEFGGYAEMQATRGKDPLTDNRALMELFRIDSVEALRGLRKEWVEEKLTGGEMVREGKWTESVAVGDSGFVEVLKRKLGLRAKGRKISGNEDESTLREPRVFFGDGLDA